MMKLTSILGNGQRLDGGAMFGNAPKALWSRWMAPNQDNTIELACRCLLVQVHDKNILLETGIGAFFEPKLAARFGVTSERHELLLGLAAVGLTDADVDLVVLSHLHFDHSGGLLSSYQNGAKLLFPNATFLVSSAHWARATAPHKRDRASFLPELHQQLLASDRLQFVTESTNSSFEQARFHFSHGHTPGLMITELPTDEGPLFFVADLIPGVPWVNDAITMGYDRFPELLIDEKRAFLAEVVERSGRLFFTHDPHIATARVRLDERNRFVAYDTNPLLNG